MATWKKNLFIPIQKGCLMKILSGQLQETKFTNNDIVESIYKQNDTSYIHNDIGTNIISNNFKDIAISLHHKIFIKKFNNYFFHNTNYISSILTI